jgi:hypothetical protein
LICRLKSGIHTAPLDIKKENAGDEELDTKNGTRIDAIIKPKLIDYIGEKAILKTVTDITEGK